MKCRRSEELWSDYLDGQLPSPLVKDLEDHLATCLDCPALLDTFRVVVDRLRSLPRPQPSPELAGRILAASRPSLEKLHRADASQPSFAGLSWTHWAAWGAAAALVVLVFVRPGKPLSELGYQLNQFGHKTYSFGLRVYRDTEGLIDELNVLRMTVGVAFEDRLDRLNQRLKDLEEARRKTEGESDQSSQLFRPQKFTKLKPEPKHSEARSLL